MSLSRRSILASCAALAAPPVNALDLKIGSTFPQPLGTIRPPKSDQDTAQQIIARLPKVDYVAIMSALANLDKTEKWSSSGEPFNRRWQNFANPLLVMIWNDMGYSYSNDCVPWCGITLGWCLKRDRRPIPKNCASSQSYLSYGVEVTQPKRGDICVFTKRTDTTHGHVTIFYDVKDAKDVDVLGGNQVLSTSTNCGVGFTANAVDLRSMPLKTETYYINRYVRPPARS